MKFKFLETVQISLKAVKFFKKLIGCSWSWLFIELHLSPPGFYFHLWRRCLALLHEDFWKHKTTTVTRSHKQHTWEDKTHSPFPACQRWHALCFLLTSGRLFPGVGTAGYRRPLWLMRHSVIRGPEARGGPRPVWPRTWQQALLRSLMVVMMMSC